MMIDKEPQSTLVVYLQRQGSDFGFNFMFLILNFDKLFHITSVEKGWVRVTEKNTHTEIQSCV